LAAVVGVVACMLAGMVPIVMGKPLFLLVPLAVLPVLLAILRRPEAIVPCVMFALFTNATVVANRYHGLPFILTAAIPLTIGLPIARDVLFRGKPLIVTPVVPLLVLFIGVQWLGALFSARPEAAIPDVFESVAEGLVLYLLVTNAIRTRRVARQVIWALILAGGFMGGLVFYQQVTRTYDNHYWGFAQPSRAFFETGEETVAGEELQLRLGGPLGQQNRFAQLMGMLLPLALFQFASNPSRRLRFLALIAFLLIGVGLSLAFSRGAVVGLGATFLMMVLMGYVRARALLVVALAVVVVALAVPQYSARLASLQDLGLSVTGGGGPGVRNADSAVRSRVTEMAAAAVMFVEHPLLGVGPRMSRQPSREYAEKVGLKVKGVPRQSHNLYLGMAAEHGILGLVIFGAILVVAFRDLARARRRWRKRDPEMANLAASLSVALFAYLATAMFLHFAYVRFFWGLLAVAGAVGRLARPHGVGARRDASVLGGRLLLGRHHARTRGAAPGSSF
jgi:O-antigen ligase